ncbi:MAG: metallophosphoesterase [Alphaproteobacteria bacterium]|nr:metallophosphoesterase [Alphaproteobacteria bacterium]
MFISLLLLACADAPAPDSSAQDLGPVDLLAPPYAQVLEGGALRLRFEVLDDERPRPVTVLHPRDGERVLEPVRRVETLSYAWPVSGADEVQRPDLPGVHVTHELDLGTLEPGDTLGWSLELPEGDRFEGTLTRPAEDAPLTVAFFGDTMAPTTELLAPLAAAYAPDVLLHGGDIQYQSNPFDTWARHFFAFAPLTALAPYHPATGNHEDEQQEEFQVMFARSFTPMGDSGGPWGEAGEGYHAFTWSGVRFIQLDTEGDLGDPESEQLRWLAEELTAAEGARATVVSFHRPIFTLAKSAPKDDFRAQLHPLFVEHGVDLVLQAHNHSYERFEVDGLTYIVDGGGGALLYDVDAQVEERPEEVPWRLASDRSFGFTIFTVDGDTIQLHRHDGAGELIDEVAVPLR